MRRGALDGAVAALALALLAAVAGCAGGGEEPGLSGTWERAGSDRARSVVEIEQAADGPRFRVWRYGEDGSAYLRCPEQGPCTIYEGDAPVYEIEFSPRAGEASETLIVDCRGTPLDGRSTPMTWVERVELVAGGEAIEVRRVELNGQPRTDGPRRFERKRGGPF